MSARATIDGLPIIDAQKAEIIHVTARDVKRQGVKDPAHCAIAETACRELGAEEARVHLSRVYLKLKGKWLRFETSSAIRTEIVSFDRSGKFQEGEYVLLPLRPSARTGERQGAAIKRGYTGRTRRPGHVIDNVRPAATHIIDRKSG